MLSLAGQIFIVTKIVPLLPIFYFLSPPVYVIDISGNNIAVVLGRWV
ncbi:MAG: hypothetical protein LBP59_11610 [Planctomycetaceae bacterium]|nr:hypothetical protein [Planctomycetaceae bacterium]